jgi:hypothetical protein
MIRISYTGPGQSSLVFPGSAGNNGETGGDLAIAGGLFSQFAQASLAQQYTDVDSTICLQPIAL